MRLIDSSSILGKVDICMDYKSKVKELIEYPREANWYEFKTNWYEPAEMVNIFLRCQMLPHWKGAKPDIWYGE